MAGSDRFHIIGGEVLEAEGGPDVLWYTRVAFAEFVLCVDWRVSSLEDNFRVYLRFPSLGNAQRRASEQSHFG
jgi:hypothetical protein